MTETTEHKTEEKHAEHKPEEHKIEHKEKFNFKKWIKGSNKREYVENISFLIIVISAIMISAGIGLGIFIQESVFISVLGAFFVMVGIVVYIVSQFIGE
jgi:F0F1-type ATP synthase assembly protein I